MAEQPETNAEIDSIEWYHSIDLPGYGMTSGWHDLHPLVPEIPFPSLDGKRCLDVATFNGFWAFEMERRGAAEVVGIDVLDPAQWDWPVGSEESVIEIIGRRNARGRGFELAREALGSSVERLERSVYELDPDEVGQFDVVYLGSLLVHLRDPVRAMERVRSVCRGELVMVDMIDLPLTLTRPRSPVARLDGIGRPWWWVSNPPGLAQILTAAGWTVTSRPRLVWVQPGRGQPLPGRRRLDLLRHREGRLQLTIAYKGDPHALLTAVPGT